MTANTESQGNFDLVRLSHAKRDIDITGNTIRTWSKAFGLPIYKMGKAAFVSRTDVAALIRTRGLQEAR